VSNHVFSDIFEISFVFCLSSVSDHLDIKALVAATLLLDPLHVQGHESFRASGICLWVTSASTGASRFATKGDHVLLLHVEVVLHDSLSWSGRSFCHLLTVHCHLLLKLLSRLPELLHLSIPVVVESLSLNWSHGFHVWLAVVGHNTDSPSCLTMDLVERQIAGISIPLPFILVGVEAVLHGNGVALGSNNAIFVETHSKFFGSLEHNISGFGNLGSLIFLGHGIEGLSNGVEVSFIFTCEVFKSIHSIFGKSFQLLVIDVDHNLGRYNSD